jgi:hypothetical protein
MAALAIGVRVALAVARLGVGAASPAYPDVARLDNLRFLARGVVQIRLNRGLRAAQATGDLRDWQTLVIAIVARERNCPTTLLKTINARHPRVRYRPSPIFPVDESRALGHLKTTSGDSGSEARAHPQNAWDES